MADDQPSRSLTFRELRSLLDDPGFWVALDFSGHPIGPQANTLRRAVEMAKDGRPIGRLSGESIFVTSAQVVALRALLAEL